MIVKKFLASYPHFQCSEQLLDLLICYEYATTFIMADFMTFINNIKARQ